MKKVLYIILLVGILFGCGGEEQKVEGTLPDGVGKIEVAEYMNGGGYTYIRGEENGEELWIAVREMPVEVGDVYYFSSSMKMEDFQSESLNRTFETIHFVDNISKTAPASDANQSAQEMPSMADAREGHGKPTVEAAEGISVDPAAGGMSVAEINRDKSSLNGKTVKVRGVVTKFNGGIMKRNWIHIQDGTSHEGSVDVTVTSDQSAKVGETVVIEGTVAVDKDFGAGYFYDIIIENAKVTVEKKI